MSVSYWSQNFSPLLIPSLENNMESEIVVIGSGIAGLTTAYLLLKEGKSVVVLTEGSLGGGETSRTTAHITSLLDPRFFDLEKHFGLEAVKLSFESQREAIDLIENICRDENIACDFERLDCHLFNPPESSSKNILEKEKDTLQRAGITGIILEDSPFSFFYSHKKLSLANQAQFHPLKYITGLAQAILKLGGKIYTNAHVVEVIPGSPTIARTSHHFEIKSSCIIVATNTPINNRFLMHTKQAAYRTYVIASYVPKNSIPKALYYDTLDPYHYVRIFSEKEKDLLIIGGEDHKTGQENNTFSCYDRLEKWSRFHFPQIEEINYYWSGQIIEPIDSLAFIGKNPSEENIYIITGTSGNGISYGTLGGMIIKDLIMGKTSPYSELYHPSRKTLSSLAEFAKENANVGLQYAKWLSFGTKNLQEIPNNSGKVFQDHLEKIAVFCDDQGEYYMHSAVCPHLGCIVTWNDAEKTWDCPCHGSRFEARGKVINGPSVSDLKKIETKFGSGLNF